MLLPPPTGLPRRCLSKMNETGAGREGGREKLVMASPGLQVDNYTALSAPGLGQEAIHKDSLSKLMGLQGVWGSKESHD